MHRIMKLAEKDANIAVQGNLRVKNGKRAEYYLVLPGEDGPSGGRYIRKSDIGIAQKIAMRDYGKAVLKVAREQSKILDNMIENYDLAKISEIYVDKRIGRRELLTPYMMSDEEFVKNWLEQEYEPMGFMDGTPDLRTVKGERVRSKSEVIIANMLNEYGIPYKYECPLLLGNKKVRPDFTVLNVRERKVLYWEHFGMLDDKDYCNHNLQKIDQYEKNGIYIGDRLIATAETELCPLDTRSVKRKIEKYLL